MASLRECRLPALVLAALAVYSQQSHGVEGVVALTPERAVKFLRPSDLHFSKDGSTAVCVVSEVNGPTIDSHLWLVRVRPADMHQITFSQKSERSPQWSPAGDRLAFLSNRTGVDQVYVMPRDGGEAQAATASATAVSEFRFSPDGNEIAYLAREAPTEHDANAPRVADSEQDLARLWILDLVSHRVRQALASSGSWRIDDFDWLTGNEMIAVASEHPRVEAWNTALYTIALDTGSMTLFGRPNQPFGGLALSPSRTRLAYVSTRAAGPIPHDVYLQELSGGPAHDASAGLDRPVLGTKWQNDAAVLIRVADGFRNRILRIDSHGATSDVNLPLSVRDFDVAGDGTVIFVGVGFDRLPAILIKHPDGAVTPVALLQEGWDGIHLADAEIFRVKSFDGTPIEAALMTPAAPSHTGKLPLVLLVHGGPAGNFSADYFWFMSWAQLLVARGYQVLLVNPRGSIGYGEKFLKANRADWGGGDYRDLMAVLDAVIARGETDTQRLGIGGWSYGAEMTQWAIGHTNRFEAAVSGGGVFDQAAEFGTEGGSAYDEWYFGTPWESPEVFTRNSPASFIRNARTPMLIVHGEDDRNNPIGQSQALYRALKHLGVESEFVTYPGEGHLPRQEKHQIDILERMLDWFDRFLK
jgi:dipeptidyl aminopeptidase/acylaminoacyl peptidase